MGDTHPRSRLAVVVAFLNEREYLPTLLASVAGQTRPPDRLLLVDDGSTDGSAELAERFAIAHPYTMVLSRPERPPELDRLANAAELQAFQWGCDQLEPGYEIIAKLDADLRLQPGHFAEVCALLDADPGIGIAGAHLSISSADGPVREQQPADHVRGPNKFYRRTCLEQIQPLPAHLGWDTLDEVKARRCGWRAVSISLSGGDSIHLRPTGAHDGRLRAFWRWGECAYGYGSHPLTVLIAGIARLRCRPYLLAGLAYVTGWAAAAARSRPRPTPELRRFRRNEELERLARPLTRRRKLAPPVGVYRT
jgi:glycosyltransferase involved in cell wall biosynthesis